MNQISDKAWAGDLHLHSRFSRATSKSMNLREMSHFALQKGVRLLGTGDLTHPEWLSEIEDQTETDNNELLKLCSVSNNDHGIRFLLTGEVSCIYKKNGRTRKIHLVILMPDINAAKKFNKRLIDLGKNLSSDGRPILGMDAKHILETALESDTRAEVIPAHIWTPWFSVFGSKSGFDSIEECFEDLSDHIHALETGLSSDPPMNWLVSSLDRFNLVSFSDAHSPANIAREATLFQTEFNYQSIIKAIRTGKDLAGTYEFFPEEGKYHLDGHRKCGVRLFPNETKELMGLCPVCKKPVTAGVLYRVSELADRMPGFKPKNVKPYTSLLSLAEIISQVVGTGVKTKKVAGIYDKLICRLGSELDILTKVPIEDIESIAGGSIGEALLKVRSGHITARGGYDGEFGKIKVFD